MSNLTTNTFKDYCHNLWALQKQKSNLPPPDKLDRITYYKPINTELLLTAP